MEELNHFLKNSKEEIQKANDLRALESLRVLYLGKKGEVTRLLKKLSEIPENQRAAEGKRVNLLKNELKKLIEARKKELHEFEIEQRLVEEKIDVTLPGRRSGSGGLHPITRTIERMEDFFVSLGFEVIEGPEIEDDHHNFGALNIPEHHPARAMHDTFYINSSLVLRTHTSPVQVRVMENSTPPLRVICPGRVYRCDSDLTLSLIHISEPTRP